MLRIWFFMAIGTFSYNWIKLAKWGIEADLIPFSTFIVAAFALFDYLPPLIIVTAVSRSMDQFSGLLNQVLCLVADNESITSSHRSLMLQRLKFFWSIRLTGMNYFTLDRSFLISYVGSVLTFAALLAGFTPKY